MKTVLLLRHAKSDWDADFDHDHERPLAPRGEKAARVMGKLLADWGQVPESVVCSTAVRARQTLELAREAGGWPSAVRTTEALYHADPEDVLATIRDEPDRTDVLMLVGHEPTWSETASALVGGGDLRFPTGAVARIDLSVTAWRRAAFGDGQLIFLLPPKLFS